MNSICIRRLMFVLLLGLSFSISAYELETNKGSIFVESSYSGELAAKWVNEDRDKSADLKLAASIADIFESFQTGDREKYATYQVSFEDLNSSEIDKKVIPRIIKKSLSNMDGFESILKKLKKKNVDITQSEFIGIKRENIEISGGLTAIRKVYLMFKYKNEVHGIYLRTMMKNHKDQWKMMKEAYLRPFSVYPIGIA